MKVKLIKSYCLDTLENSINDYLNDYLKQGGDPEVYDVRLVFAERAYVATITHR